MGEPIIAIDPNEAQEIEKNAIVLSTHRIPFECEIIIQ